MDFWEGFLSAIEIEFLDGDSDPVANGEVKAELIKIITNSTRGPHFRLVRTFESLSYGMHRPTLL